MAEPISTAEGKKHLRVESTADDTLIADKIIAAREWVEDYTGLVLTRREVTEAIDSFSAQTRLRAWPVADEPISIVYRDFVGAEQTIADAVLRPQTRPARIYPALGAVWPNCRTISGPAAVTFTAGYATAADVPQALKQAMLVMLTAFYDDRPGGEMFAAAERSAKALCRRYKRRVL
ncbi:hypothetical protein BWQ93_05905 [Sphingopyxis sp. QXT-31]|uniref:head-tail connector protein n=1 Tax=Sphingopyxis sp. QXT-31 TaxID=1357916 RepID=UPI0009796A5D|nr:head-tail connector protein [Sphingopyxis sp. QXT-31]APZ98064.1 hypothetical protein BWQ93_05905 [Sphingopyxis sp. QXT-31]